MWASQFHITQEQSDDALLQHSKILLCAVNIDFDWTAARAPAQSARLIPHICAVTFTGSRNTVCTQLWKEVSVSCFHAVHGHVVKQFRGHGSFCCLSSKITSTLWCSLDVIMASLRVDGLAYQYLSFRCQVRDWGKQLHVFWFENKKKENSVCVCLCHKIHKTAHYQSQHQSSHLKI